MGEALLIIVPLFLIGAAPAAYVRRRGGSWLAASFVTFFSQAVATGILFMVLLLAHNYPAMPNTPIAILQYALPRLLLLSLLTAVSILAFVRPITERKRP